MNQSIPRYFLYFYLFVLSFYGAEVKGLENGLFDTNELMILLSLGFLIISFVEIFKLKSARDGPGNSEMFLFLFLAWSAGTFFISVNADLSIFPTMKSLGALAFGLGLFLFLKERVQLNQIWLLSFIFAGIHAFSGIIQKFFPFFLPEYPFSFFHSQSIFVTANFFSCFLLIHIPIGLHLYFIESRSFIKILIGMSWICILVALGLSDSVAAQLIAGMQLFSMGIYFGATKNLADLKFLGWATMVAFFLYYGIIQLVADFRPFPVFNLIRTTGLEHSWFEEHVLTRLVYAWGGLKIFMEYWLTGSGLWTYRDLYPFTGLQEMYENKTLFVKVPQHAHSFFAQTAGETGIMGLFLLGGNIFYLYWNNIKKLIKERSKSTDLPFFLLISVSGFLIHNIGEYNWLNSHFVYYYAFLIVSLGFLEREVIAEDQKATSSVGNFIFIPTILFSIIVIGWSAINYKNYNQIILGKNFASKNLIEIEQDLNRAKNICERCGMPYYLSGIVNFEEAKRLKNLDLLNKAQKEFEEVIKRNPFNSKSYLFQGDIYNIQGNKEKARQSFQMVMRDSRYKEIGLKKLKSLENKN